MSPPNKGDMSDAIDNIDHIAALGYQILADGHKVDKWLNRFGNSRNEDVSNYHRQPDNILHQDGKLAVHEEDRLMYSKMKNVEYIKHTVTCAVQCMQKRSTLPLFQWPINLDEIEGRIIKDEVEKARSPFSSFAFISAKGSCADEKWDTLYGDGIDEEEFRCHCISQKTKQLSSSNNLQGLGDFISNTKDHSVSGYDCDEPSEMKQALKKFIQRCWERSLHIAFNTFDVKIMDSFGDNQETNACKSHLDASNTRGTMHHEADEESMDEQDECKTHSNLSHQAQAVMKCKELGIIFDHICVDSGSWYTCQSCHKRLKYVSNEQAMNHLFGTQLSKGCCWKMIQEKKRKLAESVLEYEAMSIIDNILQVVLKSKQTYKADKNAGSEDTYPLNWRNVCTAMLESLGNAVDFTDSKEEMSSGKTIQLDPNLPPFPLNGAIMKIVFSRLIDRYIQ